VRICFTHQLSTHTLTHTYTHRLSRDQLRRYAPVQAHLKIVDWLQILMYAAAYITSTLATPLDDQLYYEVGSERFQRKLEAKLRLHHDIYFGFGCSKVKFVFNRWNSIRTRFRQY
jgi:hypothetical protein